MAWFNKKQKSERKTEPTSALKRQDEELIAVLAAAVAAYLGTVPGNIIVRSWRHVNPAWKRSAREIQIHRF